MHFVSESDPLLTCITLHFVHWPPMRRASRAVVTSHSSGPARISHLEARRRIIATRSRLVRQSSNGEIRRLVLPPSAPSRAFRCDCGDFQMVSQMQHNFGANSVPCLVVRHYRPPSSVSLGSPVILAEQRKSLVLCIKCRQFTYPAARML